MAGELIKAREVLTIGQRVEFFVEDSEERYASRIEEITEDELIVAMPMSIKRVPIIPRTGEKLYALAVGRQCRYRFFTTFHKKDRMAARFPVWHISWPEQVERHQNREFVRVKVNLLVGVRLIDADGTIKPPESARIVDLSGNGICFAWDHEVKPGTKVALSLENIPGVDPVEQISLVARCTPISREDGTTVYHIGASFQHLSRAVSNKLVHYLFDVQRKTIAKGIKKDDE